LKFLHRVETIVPETENLYQQEFCSSDGRNPSYTKLAVAPPLIAVRWVARIPSVGVLSGPEVRFLVSIIAQRTLHRKRPFRYPR